jgi:O-antigen/teichoic acid export membrane protein
LRAFERIARTGVQVGLILIGYGVAGLFVGHALSLAVSAVVGAAVLSVRISVPRWRHFRSLLEFARYSWLGGLKGRTFGWMDTIVLGFFVTSSLVGIYEVAWTLASFFVLVANSVRRTLFPELSELSTTDSDDRIHHYINEGLVFTGIFLIPGFLGALAIGTDVLRIYGPEFTRGAFVLLLLIGARTFDAYGSQLVSAINALDRPDVAFRINGLFVALNVTLNIVLVATFGWYGAAVATALSGAVTLVVGYRAISQLIGTPTVPYAEIGRQFVAAVGMFLGVVAFDPLVPQNHYTTVLLVVVGIAIYTSGLLVLSTRIRQKTRALVGAT